MNIRISEHAKDRMKIYGISERIVIDALNEPDEVVDGYGGRKIAHKRLNHYILRVIYEEYEDEKAIITLYPAEESRYGR